MLQYHVAFYLPRGEDRMVVAEVLDFPGAVSQGFDLADARDMISSALEEMAESYLEAGRPLPTPSPAASDPAADYMELIPLSVPARRDEAGSKAVTCCAIWTNADATWIMRAGERLAKFVDAPKTMLRQGTASAVPQRMQNRFGFSR